MVDDVILIDAIMIAGILVFYTIPYITSGAPRWKKEHRSEKAALTLIALAIALFAVSAILAFMTITPLYISYMSAIGGFITITAAGIIFIKVIKIAKVAIKEKEAEEESRKLYEEPWKDKTDDEIKAEKEAKKTSDTVQLELEKDEMSEVQKDEKVIEESKTYEVLPWKDPMKEEPS
jgi:hypothetical protein